NGTPVVGLGSPVAGWIARDDGGGAVRVLVTGATGFTGAHLARRLVAAGDTVRAVVRRPDQAASLREAGIEVVAGDLTDAASLRRACEDVEVVYNIAALYRTAGLPASAYAAVNAEGVAKLIRAAAGAG